MEELYTIQNMNINIYNYLLAKVIEILTLEGATYNNLEEVVPYNKGVIDPELEKLKEQEEIAKYDINLCLDLINNTLDNSIYNLDNLTLFNDMTNNNLIVIRNVIDILDRKLSNNPKYRFEYKKMIYLIVFLTQNLLIIFSMKQECWNSYQELNRHKS